MYNYLETILKAVFRVYFLHIFEVNRNAKRNHTGYDYDLISKLYQSHLMSYF